MHDDSELIQRVLKGERSAFDALVDRYHAAVFRQALRRVRRPEDAEEVAQNVFVKAYLGLPRLQRAADFSHWLRVITARESISWLRRAHPEQEEAAESDAAIYDDALSPEDALLASELRDAVRRALDSLPEHERRVAHAYYFDGNSYREIERRYGLAHSSVAGYLYRARQRLAVQLKGMLPGVTCAPGLAAWAQNAWRLLLEGDRPMHVTRAAVAAASVVTVAMVAHQAPPPAAHPRTPSFSGIVAERPVAALHHRPLALAPAPLARPSGPAAHAQQIAERVIRTVASAADVALLGTEVAAADQEPPPAAGKAPPPPPAPEKPAVDEPLHADENDVVLRQDGRTLHFMMREGKLLVEEDGKQRPATEEETARFQRIQERVKALKARAADLEARARALEQQRGVELEARAKAFEQQHTAEAEARGKALERAAEALSRSVESRVRAQEKALEALRAQAAVEAKRAKGAEGKGGPNEREQQLLKGQLERLARAQADAQRATARIEADIKPLLEKIGPLAAEAAKAAQPNPDEIQKMVADVLAQLGPILKEAAALGEEAARLQAELGQLNGNANTNGNVNTNGKKAGEKEKQGPEKEKPGVEKKSPTGDKEPPEGDQEKPGGEKEPPERDDD